VIEYTGDIWEYPSDWLCVTTNGNVRNDGAAVMGRGIALEAKRRYPKLPHILAERILEGGNHVHPLGSFGGKLIFSFPTKNDWRDRSNLTLIQMSVRELLYYHNSAKKLFGHDYPVVAMTRPGCGNGGMNWPDVKAAIGPLLSDKFVIVNRQ
jgi:hypothetical protein